jgi:hypothetical protein
MRLRRVERAIFATVSSFGLTAALATEARGALALALHEDLRTAVSRAVLEGSDGRVLADSDWEGPLPAGYSADGKEFYVPTRLLAVLRDRAEGSHHAEAASAALWVRSLMGGYADSPAGSIPVRALSPIVYGGGTVEWCGLAVDHNQRCPLNCNGSSTKTCAGCGCKGTRELRGR